MRENRHPKWRENLQNTLAPAFFTEMIWSTIKNMPSFALIYFISNETLEKFAKLWDKYEGYQFATEIFSQFQKLDEK